MKYDIVIVYKDQSIGKYFDNTSYCLFKNCLEIKKGNKITNVNFNEVQYFEVTLKLDDIEVIE